MPNFTTPPPAPQRGDRATFSQRMDAFLTWLVALIPQLNAFIASLNARDLGGANTFVYTFDAGTADADPGAGRLRLGNTPQNVSTVLRLNAASTNGVDMQSFMTALAGVTSNNKGTVRLQRVSDPAAWMILDVSAVATMSGYHNLTVVVRSASSLSPFLNNDSLAVFIDRNGDKGDSGGTPTAQQIRDAVGTIGIANGGTGANTQAGALQNLGAMPAATEVLVRRNYNWTPGTTFASGSLPNIAAIHAGVWDTAPIVVTNDGNAAASAVICFYRTGGGYAAFFGLDTDNRWKVGGRSMGGAAYEIFHQGNFNPANYAPLSGANFWGTITAPSIVNTSDERKKENWRPITDEQLDALLEIDMVGLFDWRDGSGSAFGASAQKVREIFPDAVFGKDVLGVDYGGLNFAIQHAALRRLKRKGVL